MPTFAAVDIGANSVRLKVARLARRRMTTLHEDREVVRLGESVFRTRMLSPDAMARTVKVLHRFRKAVDQYGDVRVRVTATSALRDAHNAQAFIEWVKVRTGWEIEVISGVEEARLIHLGIVTNMKVRKWPLLLIDLGGGSCELTISNHGHIKATVSIPVGAVRLTQEFVRHDPPKEYEMKSLRAFVSEKVQRVARDIVKATPATVIATSGTAAALAWGEERFVSAREVLESADELAEMSYDERIQLEGIGTRRGEIIVAGAAVYAEIVQRCKLRGYRYSDLGLRDGLLAAMAAELDVGAPAKQLAADRNDAVTAMMQRYAVDTEQAEHVRGLVQQLFSGLKAVHRLPAEYSDWLAAAALVHEVGAFVNRTGWHRHAWYLIAHSELLGYTPVQRQIIAAITRFLGAALPTGNDKLLRILPATERENIRKAVALLRLARALNQGRRRAVEKLTASGRDGCVRLKITHRRGVTAELEVWALRKERGYFRAVFGRELEAEVS
jgi:exopolyphosphatase / guanosine-5'-triphosphate,3'-diphosphate pyrophosphatase